MIAENSLLGNGTILWGAPFNKGTSHAAWLVMHGPHLRHLRVRSADGSPHTSIVKQDLCHLLCSTCVCSSCLFLCRCQHNHYRLHSRDACYTCLSWLSFISIIIQAHLGASYLKLSWLAMSSLSIRHDWNAYSATEMSPYKGKEVFSMPIWEKWPTPVLTMAFLQVAAKCIALCDYPVDFLFLSLKFDAVWMFSTHCLGNLANFHSLNLHHFCKRKVAWLLLATCIPPFLLLQNHLQINYTSW